MLKSLRLEKINTPILILSGIGDPEDKVKGLGFGADDFVTKPFHKNELIARINAIVRRSKGYSHSLITIGELSIDIDAKSVSVRGRPVHLTSKEYQMLELLAMRKGLTLSKTMFLDHIYGGMDEPDSKIIDVFICKIRKKIDAVANGVNYIDTVWGHGYVMREQTMEPKSKSA